MSRSFVVSDQVRLTLNGLMSEIGMHRISLQLLPSLLEHDFNRNENESLSKSCVSFERNLGPNRSQFEGAQQHEHCTRRQSTTPSPPCALTL